MVYARAHDQTVAEDYFTAMQRVEERLEILPLKVEEKQDEVVKVQEQLLVFAEQLAQPEITFSERLDIAQRLRLLLGTICHAEPVEAHEHAPPH